MKKDTSVNTEIALNLQWKVTRIKWYFRRRRWCPVQKQHARDSKTTRYPHSSLIDMKVSNLFRPYILERHKQHAPCFKPNTDKRPNFLGCLNKLSDIHPRTKPGYQGKVVNPLTNQYQEKYPLEFEQCWWHDLTQESCQKDPEKFRHYAWK